MVVAAVIFERKIPQTKIKHRSVNVLKRFLLNYLRQ